MVITTISDPNMSTDFIYATRHIFKKDYSALLWKLVISGQLKFKVVSHKKQHDDGLTHFCSGDGENKRKAILVTMKDSVVKSRFVCWRLACLIHELVHVLHFWTAENPVLEGETHGECWENLVKETVRRGVIKVCAMQLVSPIPKCLYKKCCVWCSPNSGKVTRKVTRKVYKLPEVQEISTYGGNCLFCFTEKKTIIHLRKSPECKEKYEAWYGPQYKSKIKTLNYKEKRVKKRVGIYTGPSVCEFCPAPADKLLLVHLRDNEPCTIRYQKHYNLNTEEDLRKEIKKEKARMRKRKQRGTQS